MPIGFTQTAERLSGYGKIRDHLEPASALPNSDSLTRALTAQLAALSQPAANDNSPKDSIADDLSELVAQLRAMSFTRSDVSNVADTTFEQNPALNKLADGLSLTVDEVADSANALNAIADQLADIQAAAPITVGDLTDGYLQAIENATSTKQQSILLRQLASLGDNTLANADDMQALRTLAEQDARINVHQTKQLSDITGLLKGVASANGLLNRSMHEVLASNETQSVTLRHQHSDTLRLGQETLDVADDQLAHDRQTRAEQNKQREEDERKDARESSRLRREEKAKPKRNAKGQFGSDAGGDAEKGKTSFLTKLMTGDIAGLREEVLGAALGTVGFEGAAGEVSTLLENMGERRAEAQATRPHTQSAGGNTESDSAASGQTDTALSDADFGDELPPPDRRLLRDASSRAFSSIRGEVLAAALGSIGLEGAADEVERYLDDKASRNEGGAPARRTTLALPPPPRAPLSDRLRGALNRDEGTVDADVPTRPNVGSSVTSTAHIDGLNTSQPRSTDLDLFAPTDRTQERTLAALEDIASNSANAARDAAEAAQSITNNSNVTTITNNDNRRSSSGARSIANYNTMGTTLLPSPTPRVSRRASAQVMTLAPPTNTRRTSVGSQRRAQGQISSTTASMAVGTTDRRNDLMSRPTQQQQRQQSRRNTRREGNAAVSKKAASVSPMMQVAANPLAGRGGEALIASTLKLNGEEMDVIGQEMILIKDMRKTLKRVERSLPDDSLLGGLFGGSGGGLGDLFGAGDMLGDFLGGGRNNRRRDRMGGRNIERGRRGRRGGTRGGRVRSAIGNMAATAKTAISGVVGGITNMVTGNNNSAFDMAGDLFDMGGSDRRGRGRASGRTTGTRRGGLRSRIGGAFSGAMSKGKGFLGNIRSRGAGMLDSARGFARNTGSIGSRVGGFASGAMSKGKGFLGNIRSRGAGMLDSARGFAGNIRSRGAGMLDSARGFAGNIRSRGAGMLGGSRGFARNTGSIGSRVGGFASGALSKGKGFLGSIASKGAGLLGGAGSLAGAGGMLGGAGSIAGGLLGGASGLLRGAGGLAKGVLGKVPLLAPLMAAYDGFNGWNNAGNNFALEEGQEATTGQKMSSALGGIVSGLSFGLLDEGSVSRGVHSAGSMIGDLGNSVMNNLTFGLWGGDDDEEEEAKSAAAKIAKASSASLTPTDVEALSEDTPSLAGAGALTGTAAMTGLNLAKDEDKYGSLTSKVAKARERANRIKQNDMSNTNKEGGVAGSAGKAIPLGLATAAAAAAGSNLSAASPIPKVSLAETGVAGRNAESPSLLGRLSGAAGSLFDYTPIGAAIKGGSRLFGQDTAGSATLDADSAESPSLFGRMKDAAGAALSYTPMGLAYSGLSSLTSSGNTGSTALSSKSNESPSLFGRMKDAAGAALSHTPMGLAYGAWNGLFGSDDTAAKPSSSSIAAKDGTFFNPALALGGNTEQLFMGDSHVPKGGLSSATTIAGRAFDLSKSVMGGSPLGVMAQKALSTMGDVLGFQNDNSKSSKVSNLSSYTDLTNIGGNTSSKSTIASRSVSSMTMGDLLSRDGVTLGSTLKEATAGGLVNAQVEMPPSLREDALVSDTLMSSNVKAQLSGTAVNGQSRRADRNNANVVSASRPSQQPRRTVMRAPAQSNSGHSGSFNVDDTGIAIMNSILFD